MLATTVKRVYVELMVTAFAFNLISSVHRVIEARNFPESRMMIGYVMRDQKTRPIFKRGLS